MSRDHIHCGGNPSPPPHQFTTTIIKKCTPAGACTQTHWEVIDKVTKQLKESEGALTCSVCNMEHVGGWSREAERVFTSGEWVTWHIDKWHKDEPDIVFKVHNCLGEPVPY